MRFLFTRSLSFKDTNVIVWLVCHPSQTPQLKMSLVHKLPQKVSATISAIVVFHWRICSPTYPTITKSFYKYTRALQAKLARFKLNSQLALLSRAIASPKIIVQRKVLLYHCSLINCLINSTNYNTASHSVRQSDILIICVCTFLKTFFVVNMK